ncbi:MAG: mechanosensitive ion channel family protein [Gammaproteobacteria bacterium]|nr:mechanosensitive ion channel family protein [Gammaproteobacteria bacterium]
METGKILQTLTGFLGEHSWVGQVFIVVFVALLVDFLQRRLLNRLYAKFQTTERYWDDALVDALKKPLSVLIWVLGIGFAASIVGQETEAVIFAAVQPIRDTAVIAALAWFMVRLIRRAEVNMIARREATGESYDRTTMDAISKLLRLSVIITAILVAMQTLGFSVAGILAFGGIGGVAVGFAAQDLLANFFGAVMIHLDRPFEVGDWIRSPDRDIEGTVEEIGWRLTRIRRFDKRPLYVPNSAFTKIAVENPSRMHNRRIKETMGIRYDDANKMGKIVQDVEKMLREHPEIDTKQLPLVNFDTFAPCSLNFFIYAFTKTTDWAKYHQVKQDVLLGILEIIASHGAQLAFPTSTVHVPNGLAIGHGTVEQRAEPHERLAR